MFSAVPFTQQVSNPLDTQTASGSVEKPVLGRGSAVRRDIFIENPMSQWIQLR
jgi:hypothetical protein